MYILHVLSIKLRYKLYFSYKYVYFACFVNKIEIQAILFIFNTNPRFPPFLLYVRCKSGVLLYGEVSVMYTQQMYTFSLNEKSSASSFIHSKPFEFLSIISNLSFK